MCSKCDLVLAHLLLDEAEGEVIKAEFARGLAPSNAVRPLLAHEHRAQARFADLETQLDTAVAAALRPVEDLHAVVRAAVMLAMFGKKAKSISPYEAVAVLDKLTARQPDVVQAAIKEAVASLAGIFENAYQGASKEVLAEAVRQGVKPALAPLAIAAAPMELQAAAVAAHPWQRILGKVRDELGKPAALMVDEITADEVQAVLDTIKVDGTRDLAKQAINTSSGMGRIDTAVELEPSEIWASEIMDGAVCPACAEVDGRDYADMEEARQDYPNGTYKDCHGSARCRGTLVFIFDA